MPVVEFMIRKTDPALIPPTPDLAFEQRFWQEGRRAIAGIDEAGRGALAGPVAAAAVILPSKAGLILDLRGVRDSKQMTSAQREQWAGAIRQVALAWGVGLASHAEIDALGIAPATRLAAQRAIASLALPPDHLLIDYLPLPEVAIPQTSLPKGDARSLSIAAASILAKTSRDAILRDLDRQYPGYGFAMHKGYGTAAHLAAIEQLGPAPVHRQSFQPLKSMPGWQPAVAKG